MQKDTKYKKLFTLASSLTLLYVEDNIGLQKQANKLFERFFKNVVVANDGLEGLELFKEFNPDIVITDVKMPHMNGLDMVKQIREISLETQVIVTTAFDDKEKLLEAIDVGVNKYLKKPIAIDVLLKALEQISSKIQNSKNQKLFNHYVHDVFEHQDNMLILLNQREPIIVNQKTLDFFKLKNIDEFKKFFKDFDKILLKHNNFLYNQDELEWLDIVQTNARKLFNVKIKDKDGENRHFVLKAYNIPDKESFYILSFDDITELNLLALYDKDAIHREKIEDEKKTILHLLEIVKRNQSQIKIYNSYKGLNISNTGVLLRLSKEEISIKTTYLQQKAISINKYCIIESEIFPQAIKCNLKSINYENQEVELDNLTFIETKPSEQNNVRVVPFGTHKVSLFSEDRRLNLEVTILDISIDGVSVSLDVIPPKFSVGNKFRLNIVLDDSKIPLIVDLEARLYKLDEKRKNFEAVFVFEDKAKAKKLLVEYISKRQMALIREFKGLQYAK